MNTIARSHVSAFSNPSLRVCRCISSEAAMFVEPVPSCNMTVRVQDKIMVSDEGKKNIQILLTLKLNLILVLEKIDTPGHCEI